MYLIKRHKYCTVCFLDKGTYDAARDCELEHGLQGCADCARSRTEGHRCADHDSLVSDEDRLYNGSDLFDKIGDEFFFKPEMIGNPENGYISVTDEDYQEKKDEFYRAASEDIKIIGEWRFGKLGCSIAQIQYIFQFYDYLRAVKARRPRRYHDDLQSKLLHHGKLRAPSGFNMGHLAASYMAKNRLDRISANIYFNLIYQNEVCNKQYWYALERWSSEYAKLEDKKAYIVNIPHYWEVGARTTTAKVHNGAMIPIGIAKVCFFVDELGRFTNR